MSEIDECAKLVDREEMADAVAQLLGHVAGVVRERIDGVAVLPSTLVLQRLRQLPVIQRGERRDPGSDQLVDQAVVEVETLRVWLTGPGREDARPGDGEPIRVRAEVLHQRDILLIAMIVVVCDVAGIAVLDVAWCVGIGVPDRGTLAIFIPRALDLVRGRAGAPKEPVWKLSRCGPSHVCSRSGLRIGGCGT